MSIQSNINTALSLASLLATQSPTLKAKAEERAELKKLGHRETVTKEAYKEAAKVSDVETAEQLEQQLEDIQTQKFNLRPSADILSEKLANRYGQFDDPEMEAASSKITEAKSRIERYKAEKKAAEELKAKQEERRKSRRKFIDFMKDEPTSLGATIGELDPKLQKQILKTYSSAERKKIMDRGDKQ